MSTDTRALPPELQTLLDAYASAFSLAESAAGVWGADNNHVRALLADRAAKRAALVEYVAPLIEDKARLDFIDTASTDQMRFVFGYVYDGNPTRYSIDLVRPTEEPAR